MNKIFVTKNEDIASVVEKTLDAKDDALMLVIPKASRLLGSLANFHLLKREADAVGKKILVESVDEQILALAKASGLEAVNPFLSGPRRPVSDIVSRGITSDFAPPSQPHYGSKLRSKPSDALAVPETATAPTASERPRRRFRISFGRKKALVMGGIAAALALAAIAAAAWLPRAEITIVRKKHPWNTSESVVADKRVASVVPAALQIPAQLFEERRNVRLSFPASGRKPVERKATGIVTLFNAYSSERQSLVQNTRLLTPEGKLFRLVRAVTVPGAKIEEGKIIPFSLSVEVIADKPGEDYNIGPVSRFTIPGFQGSPKYQGFYAESKAPMNGGYIGEVALPSVEDLTKGREEIARTLRDMLTGFLTSQLPKDFTVPDGGMQFRIAKETIIDETDAEGKFSIFAEAEMKMLAFREADLTTLAVAKAGKELGEEVEAVELSLSLGKVTANFDAGRLELPVSYQGVFAEHIDPGLFRERAAGKTENDLRTLVAALPGFESARISLWPFWVTRVPAKVERIDVKIE